MPSESKCTDSQRLMGHAGRAVGGGACGAGLVARKGREAHLQTHIRHHYFPVSTFFCFAALHGDGEGEQWGAMPAVLDLSHAKGVERTSKPAFFFITSPVSTFSASQHLMATVKGKQWGAVPAVLDLSHAKGVKLMERHRTMLLKAAADAGHMGL